MHKPTILVTAAAGKTGAATAMQLLEKGYPVRAMVRRRDERSERLQRAGATVLVGSLEDLVDLQTAMAGAQRAYFCPPLEPGTLRRAALFAAAAEDAKLEVAVVLGQWLADPLHPAVHAGEKWLAGRLFGRIRGVDIVMVQPGWFADNYFAALEPAAQLGIFGMPLGGGLNAPPSNEDIARVVVGALTRPGPHVGKSYRPTGPRLLAPDEIAAILGKVLGRPVVYQDAPLGLFLKVAKVLGLSEFVIAQLHAFLRDYQRNAFGVGAPTDAVHAVGGSAPEGFESVARRYVAASPAVQRTLGRKLRALVNVVRALVTPAPDLDAIARRLGLPHIEHAMPAAESALWRSTHEPAAGTPAMATDRRKGWNDRNALPDDL
jgi:uncharacterized protein YbjT (DUF2867 family)